MNFLKLKIRDLRLVQIFTFILIPAFVLASCQSGEEQTDENEDQLHEDQLAMSHNFTEEELDLFVEAVQKYDEIFLDAQDKMENVLVEEGMELERFTQIVNSKQNPDMELQISEEESETFAKINEKLNVIQQEIDVDFMIMLEETGLGAEKYQEINMAVQEDQELYAKIMHKLEQTN